MNLVKLLRFWLTTVVTGNAHAIVVANIDIFGYHHIHEPAVCIFPISDYLIGRALLWLFVTALVVHVVIFFFLILHSSSVHHNIVQLTNDERGAEIDYEA